MSGLEPTRTYSNPTATEVVRRMLDERGVEWGNIRNDGSESDYLTEWQFENNQGKAIAIEWAVGSGLSVEIHRYHLTPEQAIAATLGAGTCHEAMINRHWRGCSECGYVWENMYAAGFQIGPNYCPMCGRKVVDPTTNDVDAEVDA